MSFDLLGSLSDDPREPRRAAAADQDRSAPQCSRRGCREAATWVLEWNNPRVHAPDRRKRWVACSEHREHLGEFLSARGFLKEVRSLADLEAPRIEGPQQSRSEGGR